MKIPPFLHDYFFRALFQIRDIALEHVNDYVPPGICCHLDLTTFGLDPTNYVGDQLKELRSDIVYGCQLNSGLLYKLALLHEHKSKQPERDVRLQILKYKLAICATDGQQSQPLTFVLPSVIYNGKKKWESAKFRDSFKDLPAVFLPYLAEFEYLLLDLPGMNDKDIIRRSEGKIINCGLLAMKHGHEPDYFRKNFEKVFSFDWKKYNAPIWQTFMSVMLSYISSATGFTKSDFQKLAKPLPAELNHFTMLTMESILKEGIEEGIKIGIGQGIEKGIEKGIELKATEFALFLIVNFPLKSDGEIADVTGLSKEKIATIRQELLAKPSKRKKNGPTSN